MQKEDIEKIKKKFLKEFESTETSKERKKVCKKYMEEELSSVFASLKNLSGESKAEVGKAANEFKHFILSQKESEKKETQEQSKLDVTLPGKEPRLGSIHPLTKLQKRCEKIFTRMGFVVADGPEMENEWYNFDALNFKEDHPVREMQDTFFIKQEDREKLSSKEKLLMRTHTSPVQARYMEKNGPPLRIIVPGRVFRNEATDSSHEINFYQIEGLMVGKDVSVANFKAVMGSFFRQLFEGNVEIRLRPSYFPFTEPSFETDVSCSICEKKGCSVCDQTGWTEIMGAGMVHPRVLENAKIDPTEFSGFAFGMGVDRIAAIERKIDDARLFYSGDLRFLKQF